MIEEKTPAVAEQKEPRKWEWKSGCVAETLQEAFSEELPETELQALQILCRDSRAVRSTLNRIATQVEEIQHDLRRITK
jgi:hypothetical protein